MSEEAPKYCARFQNDGIAVNQTLTRLDDDSARAGIALGPGLAI